MVFCLSIFPRLCPTSAHALHHPPSAAVTFRLPVRYNIVLFTQELPTRHEPIAQKLFRHPRRSQSGQRVLRNLPPRCARSLRRRQTLAASLLAESSLENLLRHEDGRFVHAEDIRALATWDPTSAEGASEKEISFMPARVLLQDFTGVPAVVDLAAMRDAMRQLGGDPKKINPLLPAELVIDHSVQVDQFGTAGAFLFNADLEMKRNIERYAFLRWGRKRFSEF